MSIVRIATLALVVAVTAVIVSVGPGIAEDVSKELCPIKVLASYETEKDVSKAQEDVSVVADAEYAMNDRILILLRANIPPVQKAYICYLAGVRKSEIHVNELFEVIDLALPLSVLDNKSYPRFTPYPAVTALIQIGKPASIKAIKRLASDTGKASKLVDVFTKKLFLYRELYLQIVREVEGNDVAKFMLQNAIDKEQDKDKKANLTAALTLLDTWMQEKAAYEKRRKEDAEKAARPPATSAAPATTAPAATPTPEETPAATTPAPAASNKAPATGVGGGSPPPATP